MAGNVCVAARGRPVRALVNGIACLDLMLPGHPAWSLLVLDTIVHTVVSSPRTPFSLFGDHDSPRVGLPRRQRPNMIPPTVTTWWLGGYCEPVAL